MSASWSSASKQSPCPICAKTSWCRISTDGAVTCNVADAPLEWKKVKPTSDGRAVFVRRDAPSRGRQKPISKNRPSQDEPTCDWSAEHARLRELLTPERLDALATTLGVRCDALAALEPGWASASDLRRLAVGFAGDQDRPQEAYAFPERDGGGRITGIAFRALDGSKGFAKGAKRGLTIPLDLDLGRQPVLVVEGPSDVAAALVLGLAAVGRPSNSGGTDQIATLLKGRHVLVLGENDKKDTGEWPGKEGAIRVAEKLAGAWRASVPWTLPPTNVKDLRCALHALVEGGLQLEDRSATVAAGEDLLRSMQSTADHIQPKLMVLTKRGSYGKVVATLAVGGDGDDISADSIVFAELVKLADGDARDGWIEKAVVSAQERAPWLGDNAEPTIRELIERAARDSVADALGKDEQVPGTEADAILGSVSGADVFRSATDGRAFMSVEVEGVTRTFLVRSRACQTAVRRAYYRMTERAPGAEAVQAAVNMLEARALFDGGVRVVGVRSLEGPDGSLYLDLANDAGEYVHIRPGRWEIRTASTEDPVRFWQPKGINPLPRPKRGGSLSSLRELVNVQDEEWPLIVAWLVAALRPGRAFTVLIIFGEHGSGKSTGSRMLRRIIDPNVAELRAKPRDERDLAIAARNSLVVAYDNLSGISIELSDALARLATGGGFGTRMLHTDSDEELFDATRPILINGIDLAANRADLLDRALLIRLQAIPDEERRDEDSLWNRFAELHPLLLGALLDALAVALERLPNVRFKKLPRMATFAQFAVAAEPALGIEEGAFMAAYEANRLDAGGHALEGSPIALAVEALVDARGGCWGKGSMSELLTDLEAVTNEATTRRKDWPRSVQALTNLLGRDAPILRKQRGILFERGKGTDSKRERWVRLTRVVPDEGQGETGPSSDPSSGASDSENGPGGPSRASEAESSDDPDVPDEGPQASQEDFSSATSASDDGEESWL